MAGRRAAGRRGSLGSPLRRLETGIPGLDRVLCGGLLRGGLYLLAGPPGSGKTVLSQQICFELAKRRQRSLYLTLLTESHGRMVENASDFAFFDRRALGRSIVYMSGYRELREQGLDGLRSLVAHELHRLRPTVLVVDGVAALAEAAPSSAEFRLFLNRLRAQLELDDATGLLCMPAPLQEHEATQTMADGVLVLAQRLVTRRAVRELTITKFRGSGHVGGQHVFEIDSPGITVYPRAEAVLGRSPPDAREVRERVTFGIPELDRMLGGGVPRTSVTALVGAPGSGKTTVGLHFLCAGARRREEGLYFGFYETPARLVVQADAIGLPLGRLQAQRRIELCWTPPYENVIDRLVAEIVERTRRGGARRLFVDGLEGLAHSIAFADRVPTVMSVLANELRANGVTTLVSIESPIIDQDPLPLGPESAFVENLILLRYAEVRARLRRLLSIVKVRGSGFDASVREFEIGERGIAIGLPVGSEEEGARRNEPAPRAARERPRRRR